MTWGYPQGASLGDLVPEHMVPYVHDHWLQFPPVNPMWHYLLGVIYIFLGALGLIGNGLVFFLVIKTPSLRTPSNLLVTNLAVSDFIMFLSQFPMFSYNCFNGGVWMFSGLMCEIYAFFGAITGVCSILTLVFITFDRYNVIVKGVAGAPLTRGKALLKILFCWIYSALWSVPPFFGWGRYVPEGILDSCSFDYLTIDWNIRSFAIAMFVFTYVVPVFVIMFSYVSIVKAIVAHEKSMRQQAKKMNVTTLRSNQEANAQSAEVRIAKAAVANVTLWVTCWTPYVAVVLQGLFFDRSGLTPLVSMLPALLSKSCSCYNPVVYAINHPRFRLAMKKNFPNFCINEKEATETEASKSADTPQEKEEKDE